MRITSLALFASALSLAACSTAADQAESSPTASASAGSTANSSSTGGGSTDASGPSSESHGQTTEAPSTGFPETTSGNSSSPTGTESVTMPVTSSDTGTTGIEPSSTSEGTTEATGTTGTGSTTGETTGSTTGNMGGGPCVVDEDCQLHDDCCDCYGVPAGNDDPICKLECDQSKCSEYGLDKAVCLNGQCTLEKVDCSSQVACDALPPQCEEGFLPSIDGACWTGKCVPAAACDKVPECSLCPDSMMCVEYQAWMVDHTCLPIPDDCGGKPSCACAGEVCVEPYGNCAEGVGDFDLACQCLAC